MAAIFPVSSAADNSIVYLSAFDAVDLCSTSGGGVGVGGQWPGPLLFSRLFSVCAVDLCTVSGGGGRGEGGHGRRGCGQACLPFALLALPVTAFLTLGFRLRGRTDVPAQRVALLH